MSIIHEGLPVVKVNNTLTCNSPIEIPYYSSGLFKEALVLTENVGSTIGDDKMEAQGYATKLKGESKMERNNQSKIKREECVGLVLKRDSDRQDFDSDRGKTKLIKTRSHLIDPCGDGPYNR
uniref:Uncharacterized protein n=1 Tax=Rhizophagus irregularis (strain DAOM 181602 / DAOM 197198 / MUCL 43194) TaxID=747089 RepID=U9V3I9_RHIID